MARPSHASTSGGFVRPNAIAIDGPAGSGKSTIGRALAARLGYALLDTGPLYRLVALEVLGHGTDAADEEAVLTNAQDILGTVTIGGSGRFTRVEVGGRPIETLNLHTREISTVVAFISRIPRVRQLVLGIQRHLLSLVPAIMAGRDIGTVVIPHAELKLYLDVSLQERVARRLWAQSERDLTQATIEKDLQLRDEMDSHRETSPLRIAEDAVVIRTDKLSVDETVDMIVKMCGLSPVEAGPAAEAPAGVSVGSATEERG
jgi:cytidylate kinase